MTRDEYERFLALTEKARHTLDYFSFEVEVDGESEEIFEVPAIEDGDEYEDWLEADEEILDQFPEIRDEFYRTSSFMADMDTADAYTRRAEQGFYDG